MSSKEALSHVGGVRLQVWAASDGHRPCSIRSELRSLTLSSSVALRLAPDGLSVSCPDRADGRTGAIDLQTGHKPGEARVRKPVRIVEHPTRQGAAGVLPVRPRGRVDRPSDRARKEVGSFTESATGSSVVNVRVCADRSWL